MEKSQSRNRTLKKRALATLVTLCIMLPLLPAFTLMVGAEGQDSNPFTDVKTDDWFYSAVCFVQERELMNGTSQDTFSPHIATTRGMIVTILHRLEGTPIVSSELLTPGSEFTDVTEGAYYSDAVTWAAANGIVNGYGDGRFGPNDIITRQDLAVIFMQYMNYKEIILPVTMQWIFFADEADISGYAMDAIQTFNKLGIINGMGTNESGQTIIDPKGAATRAHAAGLLMNFLQVIEKD